MPTYVGFSTIGANEPKTTNASTGIDGGVGSVLKPVIPGKKYRLVDEPLVVRDFVNALNIQQGQKVGNPGYGSTIWSYIFEPNDPQTRLKIENEIRRIASGDPRLIINTVKSYEQENGILLEVELAIAPFNNAEVLNVFFNNLTNTATLQ
jgi:phage baseplate assembly protein W